MGSFRNWGLGFGVPFGYPLILGAVIESVTKRGPYAWQRGLCLGCIEIMVVGFMCEHGYHLNFWCSVITTSVTIRALRISDVWRLSFGSSDLI